MKKAFGRAPVFVREGGSIPVVATFDKLLGVPTVLMGIGLAGVFFVALVLPRKPWAWIVHIVLICLGLTGCPTLFICIPLLIYWIKPETKAWFGYV